MKLLFTIFFFISVFVLNIFPQSYEWKDEHSTSSDPIYFVNDSLGYKAGSNGTINKTTDGGGNWVQYDTGYDQDINAIFFIGARNGWAVGNAGIILSTNDGGQIWNIQGNEYDANFNSVYFVKEKTGWAVGDKGAMYRTEDGGHISNL